MYWNVESSSAPVYSFWIIPGVTRSSRCYNLLQNTPAHILLQNTLVYLLLHKGQRPGADKKCSQLA